MDKNISSLPFEEALTELEKIVRQLEEGRANLEDAMNLYETGIRLKAHCEARLKEARLKIEKITIGPDGNPARTDFKASEKESA